MGGCSSSPDVAYPDFAFEHDGGKDDLPGGYKPVNKRKKASPPPNTITVEYYIPGYKEVSSNKKGKRRTY